MTLAAERWGFSIIRNDSLWLRVRNIDKRDAVSRFLVEAFAEFEKDPSSEVYLLKRAAGRLRYVPQLHSLNGSLRLLAPVSVDLLPFAEARFRILYGPKTWENRCPMHAVPFVQCILEAGHEGPHKYRCASRYCPGWPDAASVSRHPAPPCF